MEKLEEEVRRISNINEEIDNKYRLILIIFFFFFFFFNNRLQFLIDFKI
jgi:hypothetical protein